MIFLVSASTDFVGVFFSSCFKDFCFHFQPYDFIGKKEPAIVNLPFMYILESMKPTSTMIIFTNLKPAE